MQNSMAAHGLTEHDLAERNNYLTATDMSKIMGRNPFGNAYDVYLEKCAASMGATIDLLEPSDAMVWGAMLEDDIILWAQTQLRKFLGDPNLKATRVGIRRKHSNGVMSATLDARIEGRPEAIESKTHATVHPNADLSEWGDAWSDHVPGYILDQVLAQLACAPDLERVWVVLSVSKFVPVIYCIERAQHLSRIAAIEQAACDFWDHHILANVAPPGGPTLDTVKRVHKPVQAGKVVVIEDQLIEQAKALATELTLKKKEKDLLDASLRAAMLGADLGRSPKGHTVTITHVNVKGRTQDPYSYDRLNLKVAGILEGFTTSSTTAA